MEVDWLSEAVAIDLGDDEAVALHEADMEGELSHVPAATGENFVADGTVCLLDAHEDTADEVEIALHRCSIPRA